MSGGDFSGDGIPDVLARGSDGAMLLFRGNGFGGFLDAGTQVGAQWNSFSKMVLVGGRRPQFENDALLRDVSTGRVYLYAAGRVAWVTNATVAARLDVYLSTATNVPASVIASYRRVGDITEAAIDSPDEPSSGAGGELMVAGHPKPDDGYFWEAPDPAGDRNVFVFESVSNKAQFRGTLHWYRNEWRLFKRYVVWQGGSRSLAMTALGLSDQLLLPAPIGAGPRSRGNSPLVWASPLQVSPPSRASPDAPQTRTPTREISTGAVLGQSPRTARPRATSSMWS